MTLKTTKIEPINLDANASVEPLDSAKTVLASVLSMPGNASSPHVFGRKLRSKMDLAREHVAIALGGKDKDVFFCSGASEGNRWVVDALVRTGLAQAQPFKVLATPLEHPSMMKCLRAAADFGQIDLNFMEMREGFLRADPEQVRKSDVIVMTAAHNETGYAPDYAEVFKEVCTKAIIVSDAAQAVGRLDELSGRIDVIIASAHKMGGVVGAGAVLVRNNGKKLQAPWAGGGQEAGLRPGSESVPLIAAMGEAARLIQETRAKQQKLSEQRDEIESALLAQWPSSFVVGNQGRRLPQTTAICLDGVDGEALRIAVDQAGVCVGFGSACSALAPEPSPALLAFGLNSKQARATIRISLSGNESDACVWEGVQRLKAAVGPLLK